MGLRRDEHGVTAVIGTIMILGITVMGITAVMFWGGPTLQRLQEQNAQAAMLGEFQEIRRDSLVLSITDSSRVPRITLDSGTFGMREGTRIQVSAMWDAAGTCDFHVTDWGYGANPDVVRFYAAGCGDPTTDFEVYSVTGSNVNGPITPLSVAADTPAGYYVADTDRDLSKGDWLFALDDGNAYAEAWLVSTHKVFWELRGASSVGLSLEGGAVFSSRDGTTFVQEQPPIAEEAFGTNDFVIRLPTYGGTPTEHSGRTTPSLFLGLVGNHLRTSQDEVHTVRLDFRGPHAQAWCNTMLGRNGDLAEGSYAEAPGFECDQSGDALRGLVYTSTADPVGATCTDCFPFEFIHARITTAL